MIPDYLLIGHITADYIDDGASTQRAPGGTVVYSARTASAFGLSVGVVTSAHPNDPVLASLAIGTTVLKPAERTTTFTLAYTDEGRRLTLRDRAGVLDLGDVPDAWRRAPFVHLAPIADELDASLLSGFPAAQVLLTPQGLLRTWDKAGRVRFRRWLDPSLLRFVAIVVMSEEDIADEPGLEDQFAAHVRHVFITRAERGGTYYCDGVPINYGSTPSQMLYPTGAGDIFAAALLATLVRTSGDMRRATRVAAQLGATSVLRPGLKGVPTPQEAEIALATTVDCAR